MALGTGGAIAVMWNDPGVVPVQRISDHRWINANNGHFINVTGMPNATPTAPTTPTPPTTPTAPTTPTGGGTTAAPTGGGTPKPKTSGWKGMSTAGKAAGALGAVGGAYGMYASTAGQDEHTGMDVVGGTTSGAVFGASVGSMVPGIGTAIGAGVGAVIGGLLSGSQLFSETDCLHDPVTGAFTCCNTLFNQGQRQAAIGDYMFCADANGQVMFGGVRQCLQGDSATKKGWWDGLWADDHWTNECKIQMCAGVPVPNKGNSPDAIVYDPDKSKFCWNWKCADGYNQEGDLCVAITPPANAGDNQPTPVTSPQLDSAELAKYNALIKKLEALRAKLQQDCMGE